jgi:hypothetical protein
MFETLKADTVYIGSVTQEKFTILEIKKRYRYSKEEEIKFLCSKSGKEIIASIPLVMWLIKSGGLV